MHIKIPHKFSKEDAVTRVKGALNEARGKFVDKVVIHEEKWEGDTLRFDFTAEGQRISGTLAVEDTLFVLDAQLPFMLRLFEGKIEKMIGEQAKQML